MILSYIKNNRDYKNMSYKEAKEYELLYSMDQFTLTAFKIEEYLSNPELNKDIDVVLLATNYSKINEFLLEVKEMKDDRKEYLKMGLINWLKNMRNSNMTTRLSIFMSI